MGQTDNELRRVKSAIEALREVERLAVRELGWGNNPPTVPDCGQRPPLSIYYPTAYTVLAELGLTAEAEGLKQEIAEIEATRTEIMFRLAYGGAPEQEYADAVEIFGPIERMPSDPREAEETESSIKAGLDSKINYVRHRVQRLIGLLEADLNQNSFIANVSEDAATTKPDHGDDGKGSGGDPQNKIVSVHHAAQNDYMSHEDAEASPQDTGDVQLLCENERARKALLKADATIPPITQESPDWGTNKHLSMLLGFDIKTLANRRSKGEKNRTDVKSSGIHNEYCYWRKEGKKHPKYYLPWIKEYVGHLRKTFPKLKEDLIKNLPANPPGDG